jgi:hypothetical protein
MLQTSGESEWAIGGKREVRSWFVPRTSGQSATAPLSEKKKKSRVQLITQQSPRIGTFAYDSVSSNKKRNSTLPTVTNRKVYSIIYKGEVD